MLDLSQSVIMPRDDFEELTTVAFGQHTSLGERTASVVQTVLVCASLAGAFIAATKSWKKSMVELDDAKLANKITELEEIDRIRTKQ